MDNEQLLTTAQAENIQLVCNAFQVQRGPLRPTRSPPDRRPNRRRHCHQGRGGSQNHEQEGTSARCRSVSDHGPVCCQSPQNPADPALDRSGKRSTKPMPT